MTGNLIVGKNIIDLKLLQNADEKNLKNSTYDLSIGEIIPIGQKNIKDRKKTGTVPYYYLAPGETIFVVSTEEFQLPACITGIATLRTTFTKKGLLALNVGIIDPYFNGPISTALLNFSDKHVGIEVGEKFFRVLFISHDAVEKPSSSFIECTDKITYVKDLENKAYSEFPKTYLNVPLKDEEFYYRNFWKLIRHGITHGIKGWTVIAAIIIITLYIYHIGFFGSFYKFLKENYEFIKEIKSMI